MKRDRRLDGITAILAAVALFGILVSGAFAQMPAPPPTCEEKLAGALNALDNKTFQCGQAAVLCGNADAELAQARSSLRQAQEQARAALAKVAQLEAAAKPKPEPEKK